MGVLSESEAATSALMHAARVSPRVEERHATQAGGGVLGCFPADMVALSVGLIRRSACTHMQASRARSAAGHRRAPCARAALGSMLVRSPAGTRPAGGCGVGLSCVHTPPRAHACCGGGGPLGEPNLQHAWVRKL